VSEVMLSRLYSSLRIDAETYRPFYMDIQKMVTKINHITLGKLTSIFKKGIFDIKADNYSDYGTPFVRISNLKNMGIDDSDIIYIPKSENDKNINTYLSKGDIILSKTAIPAASIVQLENCNTSQDTVAIKLKDECNFKSSFLVSFLNSKYGYFQMQRWFTGNIQMHLNLTDAKGIFIPQLGSELQNTVDDVFWHSFKLKELSQQTYIQAENLLLETLGLKDFKPSQEKVNIKSFKESFLSTGRLDAEYYQVKYEEVENKFNKFERIKLAKLVSYQISSGITPKAGGSDYTDKDNGIPFIRAVDLQNGEVATSNFIYLKSEIHKGILKRTQIKNGDVLFSIAGTVGRSAIFNHNFEANINQAVSILRFEEKEILRLYLVCFFNTEIGKIFISKYSRQGVQTNLNLSEVGELKIPIIDFRIQQQISDKIEESFRLKKQSEQLLELAKTAVEMAIEKDEEKAMGFIEKGLKEIEN